MSLRDIEPAIFLAKYNLPQDALVTTGLLWDDLIEVHDTHSSQRDALLPTAEHVAELLRRAPSVHSVRTRVKNPEHLIDKIVRKKLRNPAAEFKKCDYRAFVTDLVGARALHLFKGDWEVIHEYVQKRWATHEQPIAYVRDGDDRESFIQKNLDVKEHEAGYRSVHYLLETKFTKEPCLVELQVRTLFEEGWSEIDHRVRYPNDTDDPLLAHLLLVFNRLAGGADDLGTFVTQLKKHLDDARVKEDNARKEHQGVVADLMATIQTLKVDEERKRQLTCQVDHALTTNNQLRRRHLASAEWHLPGWERREMDRIRELFEKGYY